MRTPDISSIFSGLMVVVMIALATGNYRALEKWARHQGAEVLAWKQPLPYFFGVSNIKQPGQTQFAHIRR